MFVKCRGDRKTTAKFLRIQNQIDLGASVYVMSFTSYGFIHKKLPGDHNLRGTDLERSLAVYQWLVEARCSTRGTVGPRWACWNVGDPGCRLRVAPQGSCAWKDVDPQQVWDSWWYQFPSRTVTSSPAQRSWFHDILCFLYCLSSSHDIEKILKPESRR